MTDWFTPGEIVFSRPQMIFLIEHLDLLKEGNWPPNPNGSSYIDPAVKGRIKAHAYFEIPAQYYAEVSDRLEATGQDGEVLQDEINSGLIEIDLLSRVARSALNYMSGWRRRKIGYALWNAQRKYYYKSIGK